MTNIFILATMALCVLLLICVDTFIISIKLFSKHYFGNVKYNPHNIDIYEKNINQKHGPQPTHSKNEYFAPYKRLIFSTLSVIICFLSCFGFYKIFYYFNTYGGTVISSQNFEHVSHDTQSSWELNFNDFSYSKSSVIHKNESMSYIRVQLDAPPDVPMVVTLKQDGIITNHTVYSGNNYINIDQFSNKNIAANVSGEHLSGDAIITW